MSDFKDVMKNWRRMCRSSEYKNTCRDCPIYYNPVCGNVEELTDKEIEDAEKIITEWAEKNPEKIYPTWKEWLVRIGVVDFETSIVKAPVYAPIEFSTIAFLNEKGNEPIPADIAEKLGLEPK